ncbi:MAG: Plug domain-containing protein, partial [Moraxellaceae bacterium]
MLVAPVSLASFASPESGTPATDTVLPAIVIQAHPLNRTASDLATPINVLERDQLAGGATTLGQALEGQVGIQADTFGGGASRPVIRGQSAARVKVLSDGSEVMDASAISTLKANLKETEAGLVKMKSAKMPASQIQKIEEGIASLRKTIAEQDDPTPNKTRWNKMYPLNPADAVKASINEYLTLAATVDFSATTTVSGRRKKFDNMVFEKKSLKWKAIYRAGKEVNGIATSFCKDWLNQGVKIGQNYKTQS